VEIHLTVQTFFMRAGRQVGRPTDEAIQRSMLQDCIQACKGKFKKNLK
jgi:hypothetical protein